MNGKGDLNGGDIPDRHRIFATNAIVELAQKTHQCSERWGLGSERTWNVNAATGCLYLRYADEILAECPYQVVGRYDPGASSFEWHWATVEDDATGTEHASLVRTFGQQGEWGDLTEESAFPATLGNAWEFVALAVHLSGAASAYRAVDAKQRSVFMTLGRPSFRDATGQPVDAANLPDPAKLCAISADEATDLVKSYCFEVFTQEELFQEQSLSLDSEAEKVAVRERIVGDIRMAYAMHWRRADTKWVPSQIRWPSDHEFMRFSHWRTIPMRDGGRMVVFEDPTTDYVPPPFVVRRFDDGLKITRRDRMWGERIFRPDHRLIDQSRSLYFSQTAARE